MTKLELFGQLEGLVSSFWLRHFFVIRHSSFVI